MMLMDTCKAVENKTWLPSDYVRPSPCENAHAGSFFMSVQEPVNKLFAHFRIFKILSDRGSGFQ